VSLSQWRRKDRTSSYCFCLKLLASLLGLLGTISLLEMESNLIPNYNPNTIGTCAGSVGLVEINKYGFMYVSIRFLNIKTSLLYLYLVKRSRF
jgi:hypothetical protein